MAGQDRDGGVLFTNDKKTSPNAPDFKGELRITREVVDSLVQQLQRGVQFPSMELAGWKKVANNGNTFISMSGKKPYEKNGGGGTGGGGQGAGRGGQWPPQGQPAYGAGQQGSQGYGSGSTTPDDEIPFDVRGQA